MLLVKLQSTMRDTVVAVTGGHWKGFCSHVRKVEDKYWIKDAAM
jgi:hypothetical protein